MLKKVISKTLKKLNYEIKPLHNGFSINNNLKWLKDYSFDTILDIGANEGQFALFIHNIFQDANVLSFEPITDCYKKIVENNKNNSKIKPFNYALGYLDEEMEIYKNEFSPSSSLLKMNSIHIKNFPYTKNQTKEKIKIRRLDNIFKDFEIGKNVLMKIDVQGYEINVLKGAINFINIFSPLLIIETSFVELYEKEPLFNGIYEKLIPLNYKFIGILDQLYSPIDGRVLQGDAVFERAL